MKENNYSEITKKIIDCAREVHSFLGYGFQKEIYQRALAFEMVERGLSYAREFEIPIFYKDVGIGTRKVDFLVENKISVEINALTQLEKVDMAQAINYPEAYNLEAGLLLNFGATSLEFQRFENKKIEYPDHSNNHEGPVQSLVCPEKYHKENNENLG